MAAVSRRRRFFVLLFICCVTYFLFSWFIKSEDFVSQNESFVTDMTKTVINKAEQDFLAQVKAEENADDTFTLRSVVTMEVESAMPQFLKNTKPATFDDNKRLERLERLKKFRNLPANMFDFHSDVTSNPELEPSGPTGDDDESLYMKALIRKAGSSSSKENYVTQPYVRQKDEEEYSGSPTTEISITKPPTAPPQYPVSSTGVVLSTENEIKLKTPTLKIPYIKPTKNPALIIDTPGCKIPKMDPFDPSVKDLIEVSDVYLCHEKPMFMTAQPHGIIHLNASVLKEHYNATLDDIQCWYQGIIRKHEKPGNVRENDYKTTEVFELKFDKPLEHEYIAAKCFFKDNHTHEQYLPLVTLKKDIEKKRSKIKPSSPLNVILLGIDSISKLNFMRHFKKVKAFLDDKIKPFDMKGYTKVGDNTFPNLVPLLTGHFVEYYWNETVRDTFVFDSVDLIWKDYARKGFRTFYAEDSPYTGTFNYIKRGFHDPPTDYYFRPLALAIENSELRQNNKQSGCLNNELDTDIIYDYLTNFVKTMDKKPYIGFAMVSTLTHDYLNSASYADPPAARNLEDLYNTGAFNNSMVVLFSDHGLRFGKIRHTYIGKFEERMPFMYVHFPQWFLDQHPDFKRNLDINQDRLITLFDVHATMKHLLNLDGYQQESTDELGLSLLEEIPATRTCDEANILQHWCPCNNFDPVSVKDAAVVNASQAIVDHINNLLASYSDICETLEVAEVTDSRLGLPNVVVLKFERHENVVENRTVILGDEPPLLGDYLITLTVKPGGAIFEGTVRYDAQNHKSKVMGISRISMYGKTSHCINSQKLKIYCYCKSQLPTSA